MTDVMTSKKRRKKKVPYPFAVELIEQLQGQVEHKDGESILGETGLAGQLKKMLAERMLSAELSHHLLYGTQVSPELISTITDEVLEEVAQWQQRPLEALYPIVYFDALRLKIRDEGTVKNKAVYLALGVRSRRPLRQAEIVVADVDGEPGWYKVDMKVRPYFKYMGASFTLSLVGKLQKNNPSVAATVARLLSLHFSRQRRRPLSGPVACLGDVRPDVNTGVWQAR